MKQVFKRFLSLALSMLMVLTLLPAMTTTAWAATSGTVTGLTDKNIGLSFTGDADDAWSANGTSITGAVTSTGGTCSDTSYKSTLTIKNNKATKATLSFAYAIEQNSGTIKVNGTAVTTNGKFSKELEPNASIKVYIESGSTTATKITMTNVALVSNVTATVTFQPAENGTYTVDGKAVTEEYSNTQSSMTAYKVVATPADGYQFLGWYNLTTGKCIATAATTALNIESDCTITAKFVSKSLALFETGGQRFADLDEAVSYAQANRQSKITLAADGSISGTYTIPAGITLLIPFDAAGTLYTDAPAAIRTAPASRPFRTLTMSEGTSITVNGAISLGGRYYAAGGGEQGRPVGDYGYIKMADNSSITVKNGGNLYAWGFISGSGSVLAESGATVYEFYQIADFRGGSASSNMHHEVFPFSQYFVQNIEVPLTLNAGANEKVYSGVYAMSTTYTTSINFIGNNGMFKVKSGSFTKDYDEKTDRLVFTVKGEAELNTLSLKLAGMSVNSASYVLPITNNITINIQSGNVTINQDAALLAGVEVNIAEGAGLTVSNGKNVYIYDSDEWNSDNFVWGPCKFKSVAYAPGKAYNRTNADLKDTKIDVNGSVTAIGAIYTTKGGADICSSNGTGKYIQQGTPGTATATYQYNANGNKAVTIPITAAKLHNADGTYTETATANAGDVINYVNGVWGGKEPVQLTVTFEANGSTEYPVEGTMAPQTVLEKTDAALNANTFTRKGYNFKGWNTAANGTGTSYADGATVNLTADTTLYAQWERQKFTVTWKNWDDTVLKTDTVEYGTVPEYTGETPTKAPTEQYTYVFAGWTPEITAVTADVTYTATFTEKLNKYTVTWVDEDGTVLETSEVEYGTVPTYPGETPTKAGNAQYTYTFKSWNPEIEAVTRDVTYKATYEKTVNKYTVTWKNEDGTVLETSEVEYGTVPTYSGETPTKAGDAQYTYVFASWTPEIVAVTGDATYTAKFTNTIRTYTVTWKNGDTVLEMDENVPYGAKPEYNGETPTKEADAQYTYAFAGWDTEIAEVTGNATYTATFTKTLNKYTVTWKNGDTVLKTDTVEYGTTPAYNGDTPTKAADAQYTYTFKGWTPEVTAVTGNAEYTAMFTETVNTYTVTWKNWDGTELEKDENVPYGTMPSFDGTEPTKEADAQYRYTFKGWDTEIAEVTGDVTYTAQYSATARVFYTITFDANGGTGSMEPQRFEVGVDTALNTNAFTRENYKFTGWNTAADGSGATYADPGAILELSGDMTLYAQWQFQTGWVTDGTGRQYYKNGELQKTGWTEIDGETYYLNPENGYAATGIVKLTPDGALEEARCVFDADGVFQKNVTGVYTVGEDTYWLNSGIIEEYAGLKRVVKEDGEVNYYYFGEDGKAVKNGNYKVEKKSNDLPLPCYQYHFDANGIIEHDADTSKNGIDEETGSDKEFYFVDGIKVGEGLLRIKGKYYYARTSTGEIIKNQGYWITKTNGLPVAACMYHFDADGVMQINGFVTVNGGTYYHEKGTLVKGFAKIGDDYYFFNKETGKMYKDANMWVPANDHGVKPGMHYFNADGKMVVPNLETGVRKIVTEDGNLYFTIDGVKMVGGLYELGGAYYYAQNNGELAVNCSAYVGTELLAKDGWYGFGADGKLIMTGFVTGGGKTFYYADGVRAKGLTKIDEDYYFFNARSGMMYKDANMWVGKNTYGVEPGMHYFNADGKMVVPNLETGVRKIVIEDGKLYFTIDGARMYSGLYELEGAYYYALSNGQLVVDDVAYIDAKPLKDDEGWYGFDAAGKLIMTGFVTGGDGYTYYYNNGERAKGFTKIGEDYYFFNARSGKLYKDATLWVGTNDLGIEVGMHYFGTDGKMTKQLS